MPHKDPEQRRKYLREWYRANPEKRRTYQKEQRAKHYDRRLAYEAKWRSENRERIRGYSLATKYDLTFEQFEKLKVAQHNACAVCKCSPTKWCVDHDHRTEKVRGLLCDACNVAIGHLRDDATIVREAAAYLERSAT